MKKKPVKRATLKPHKSYAELKEKHFGKKSLQVDSSNPRANLPVKLRTFDLVIAPVKFLGLTIRKEITLRGEAYSNGAVWIQWDENVRLYGNQKGEQQ